MYKCTVTPGTILSLDVRKIEALACILSLTVTGDRKRAVKRERTSPSQSCRIREVCPRGVCVTSRGPTLSCLLLLVTVTVSRGPCQWDCLPFLSRSSASTTLLHKLLLSTPNSDGKHTDDDDDDDDASCRPGCQMPRSWLYSTCHLQQRQRRVILSRIPSLSCQCEHAPCRTAPPSVPSKMIDDHSVGRTCSRPFFFPVSTKTLTFYADCLGNAVMENVAVEGK